MLSKAPKIELSKLLNPRRIRANSNILPVLSVSNTRGFITQSEQFSDRRVASEDTSNYKVVLKDDYAYNPARINVGSLARLRTFEKGIVSPMYVVFSANEKVSKNYLDQFFYSSIFKQQMKVLLSGSVRQTLDFPALQEMTILLPKLTEQEKIGAFLSTIDRLIEKQKDKLERIKSLKKGYLQKMFPAEGNYEPKIKFSNQKGSWKNTKLDILANRFDSQRIPIAEGQRVSGSTPYYGANGIQGYVEGFTHDGEFILVAEDGASDLVNYPIQLVNGKVWVNNHAHVIQAKKDKLNNIFLRYSLAKTDFQPFLVGGGRAKLNSDALMKMEIPYTSNLIEQEKIGSFLSAIDRLIEKEEASMKRYDYLKKGYLQKIFAN